jgi:transposase
MMQLNPGKRLKTNERDSGNLVQPDSDLEAGRVVDLLPDREGGTVATWLQEHPGTEIVSRERASAYAKATRRASPEAIQITDL